VLEEAIGVMCQLWHRDLTSHRGRHYTVENARINPLPDEMRGSTPCPASRST
jgi:alkanesulfonate monooxygenase SsuD/methylene tetrahydromethanopterin reductase-like flavin-dependent oxidoreductase (luciferase family)